MTWQYNGSKSTIDEFRTLSREIQYEVIEFIKDFTIYEELTANGKNIYWFMADWEIIIREKT